MTCVWPEAIKVKTPALARAFLGAQELAITDATDMTILPHAPGAESASRKLNHPVLAPA